MYNFLKKRLSNENGGIESIFVSMLFIIVSLIGLISFSTWYDIQKDEIEIKTVAQIDKIFEENAPAASDITSDEIIVREIEVNEVNLKIEE